MKKKILISLSYLLVAMLATVATLAAVGYPGNASGSKLEQLESLILERFIGDADQTAMEDAAADAMVKSLGDRWSYYIPASEYAAHEEQVNNAYVGVGITIEVKEQEGFLVKEVKEGGPAQEAGVQVDDLLIEVEGQDIREMTAAAEVDGVHLVAGSQLAGFLDMVAHRVQIAVHQLVVLGGHGVEVAVLALAAAEGDVDVKSKGRFVRTFIENRHGIPPGVKSFVSLRPVSGRP